MKKLLLSMCMMPMLAFAQAVLPTSWSFITPSPTGASSSSPSGPPTTYTEKSGWITKLDVSVSGNSPFTYADGSDGNASCRLDGTGEYLTIAFAEKPGALSYYIKGTGIGSPSFSGSFAVQESVDGQTWSDMRTFTSMTNAFVQYTNNPASTSRYVRFFYTTKVSGTNVALDNVSLAAAPQASTPTIVVKSGLNTLLNNALFNYGNPSKQTLTISNTGTAQALQIDSIIVSGANASDYTIGSFKSSVAANASDTFSILFNPAANGSRFATVKIYSNDTEKNPYIVNLYGIGGNFASEPARVPSISINNVRTYAFWVTFSKANTEKYIVLRKTGSTLTEVPVDGVTYKVGDYIGNAQVAYIGTDTATIKPLYILANTSYTFGAFSFNGPEGYENYNTANAATATTTTLNAQIGTYYAAINPASSTFITDLATRLRAPHDTIFYSNYASTLVGNFLTRDTSGGKKVVNCVYTGAAYVYEGPFYWNGGGPGGILTREHTFAQSWMPTKSTISTFPEVNGKEILEYNDLHHLFPADQINANGVRSNLPFGTVVNVSTTSPTGFGKRGTDSRGVTVYEPKDDQKGNLARALFYMLVRYNGERGNQWRLLSTQDINVLLQWHQQDPPDGLEVARNEYIASVQHNRNPFIDNPQWVNRINFATMAYIADPNGASIAVTAPAVNATVIAGKTAAISWTSANVDSVFIELQTAPGVYKSLGKYLASLGTVNYRFNENANGAASIRISKVSDASVNASSSQFAIVKSAINITAPTQNQDFTTPQIVVKWTKDFADAVNVKCYLVRNGAVLDSTIITNPVAADSAIVVVPLSIGGTYVAYVTEKDADKETAFLAADSVEFTVTLTGLAENNRLNDKVSIYPVPSNGLVNVTIAAGLTINSIEAYDITGRLVQSTTQNNLVLPGKGLYILHVMTDKGMAIKKITVQ